jgi:quercetin dioxygenase-like cupin family protein
MSADQTAGAPMVMLTAPPTAKAAADRFTGDVWVDGITDGAAPGCARLATVRFSPGARTAWHCHARGQTLHVTDGRGRVQSRDGHTIVMRPGDTVYTPPASGTGAAHSRIRSWPTSRSPTAAAKPAPMMSSGAPTSATTSTPPPQLAARPERSTR